MKKLMNYTFVAIFLVTILTACSNKSIKQANLIPKDANFVLILDQKAMNEKLKDGNFSMDSILNKITSNIDETKAKKLMTDWKNSGINTDDKVIVFTTQNSKKGSFAMSINAIANLKDAAKFETFLKSQEDLKTVAVNKGKNYSSVKVASNTIISWTTDVAMITLFESKGSGYYDTLTHTYKMLENNDNDKVSKIVENYYTLKDDQKITSVKYFNEMLNKKADAYMFTSSASVMSSLSMLPFQIPKLEELLQDNYSTSYINFENGKMVADGTTFLNDKLNAIIKQYSNSSVKLSMLENFPATNTNAAMLMSFKPEMIGGFLKELQLETLIDAGLSSAKMNFTLQDIYKCLKGDVAVAVGDFSIKKMPVEGAEEFETKPVMKLIFNAEIGDKTSFTKILSQAVQMQLLINNNGIYTINPAMAANAPVYVRIDDKNIIIASDETTYTQYIAKTTKAKFNNNFTSNMSGKSMAMYFNINSFIAAALNEIKDAQASTIMNKALLSFDDVVATIDNCNDGKIHSNMTLNTKNEKENSLVTMANFFKTCVDEISVKYKDAKANENNLLNTDSTLVLPDLNSKEKY